MNKEKAGAGWVIGVSAPAVVTGIYKLDDQTRRRCYRLRENFRGHYEKRESHIQVAL